MATLVLRPYTVGSNDTWGSWGAATKVDCTDPGKPIAHDDYSSYIYAGGAGVTWQEFKPDTLFPEKMSSITNVTMKMRARQGPGYSGSQIAGRLTDSEGNQAWAAFALADTWTEYSKSFALRSDSAAWTEDDLRNSAFEWGVELGDSDWWLDVTSLWIEVEYLPAITAQEFSRSVASQILLESSRPLPIVELDLPLSALDSGLCSHIHLTHPEGVEHTGNGWGYLMWERRLLYILSLSHDPLRNTVHVKALDMRRYLRSFWDTGISPYSVQSGTYTPDGPARLDEGQTRNFTRDSNATIEEEGGYIVELGTDEERIGPSGMLFEPPRTNYVKNSAFADWTDAATPEHWPISRTNTHCQSSKQTTTLLFNTGVTAQGIKLDRHSSGAIYLTQNLTSEAPSGNYYLSFDYMSPSTFKIRLWLDRTGATSTVYWHGSSWASGTPPTLASSGSDGTIHRYETGPIAFTCSATNQYKLWFNPNINSQHAFMYHVQLEQDPATAPYYVKTSRIVTSSAIVTRKSDSLSITVDHFKNIANKDRGTILFQYSPTEVTSNYNAAKLMDLVLGGIATSAGHLKVQYAGPVNAFQVSYGGGLLTHSTTLDANDIYNVAFRWTSTEGELGRPNRSMDLFIDGQRDTTGDIYTDPGALSSARTCYIGRDEAATTFQAMGYIKNLTISPYALSCGEIVDWFSS